jgi:hypothetical protein
MPMIRTCSAPGCRTRTLGEFCLENEPLQAAAPATSPEPDAGRRRHQAARSRSVERTPRDAFPT